jgi:hypothetical protein
VSELQKVTTVMATTTTALEGAISRTVKDVDDWLKQDNATPEAYILVQGADSFALRLQNLAEILLLGCFKVATGDAGVLDCHSRLLCGQDDLALVRTVQAF